LSGDSAAGEPRRLSAWLLAGILLFPVVFTWFLLRRGYSGTLRLGGFLYLAFTLALGIARTF
jgi:hypothetical protein